MNFINIARDEALDLLGDDNVIVLDVRTKEELEVLPSITEDAIHIDFRSFDFEDQILELDPEKTYLVTCRIGVRSFAACNTMAENGFKNLYNLQGGLFAFDQPCNA